MAARALQALSVIMRLVSHSSRDVRRACHRIRTPRAWIVPIDRRCGPWPGLWRVRGRVPAAQRANMASASQQSEEPSTRPLAPTALPTRPLEPTALPRPCEPSAQPSAYPFGQGAPSPGPAERQAIIDKLLRELGGGGDDVSQSSPPNGLPSSVSPGAGAAGAETGATSPDEAESSDAAYDELVQLTVQRAWDRAWAAFQSERVPRYQLASTSAATPRPAAKERGRTTPRGHTPRAGAARGSSYSQMYSARKEAESVESASPGASAETGR